MVEIIKTVNPGLYPFASRSFANIAIELETGFYTEDTLERMHFLVECHCSDHVRDLASEVILYWGVKV